MMHAQKFSISMYFLPTDHMSMNSCWHQAVVLLSSRHHQRACAYHHCGLIVKGGLCGNMSGLAIPSYMRTAH